MKLKTSVLCHQFDDKSGVLLYDTSTDISVLLNWEECASLQHDDDGGVRVRFSDSVAADLTRKGFLLGT